MCKVATDKGARSRTRLLAALVTQATNVWLSSAQHLATAVDFVDELAEICLYNEHYKNRSAQRGTPPPVKREMARCIVLIFLDLLINRNRNKESTADWAAASTTLLNTMIIRLLDVNFEPARHIVHASDVRPGDAQQMEKLRCWQALGMLSRALPDVATGGPSADPGGMLPRVHTKLWKVVLHHYDSVVRHQVEQFAVVATLRAPHLALAPVILTQLQDVNLPVGCIATYVIVGSAVCHQLPGGLAHPALADCGFPQQFLDCLLPLLSSVDGVLRTLSQAMVAMMLDAMSAGVREEEENVGVEDGEEKGCSGASTSANAYINGTRRYLSTNLKARVMIEKQRSMLETYNPASACTLQHLLSTADPFTQDGDVIPIPFVKRVQERMMATFDDFARLEAEAVQRAALAAATPEAATPETSERDIRAQQRAALAMPYTKTTSKKGFLNAAARALETKLATATTTTVTTTTSTTNNNNNDVDNNNNNSSSSSSSSNFSQRKIVPWDALGISEEQEGSGLQKKEAYAAAKKQHIIVVASLIDKTPNLAGLARTCEIFQAEQLVLPSMRCTKEKLFKQISVTANQWIDVHAVAPGAELHAFLGAKRAEGYTIVGLEQTVSSRCITQYEFPDRVVVLLGTEGQGIPHEYMKTLDTAVEIPQLGIIRSLNVHVSGALLLWEYTRQQMMSKGVGPHASPLIK